MATLVCTQLALSVLRDVHRQHNWNIGVERPSSTTGNGNSNSGESWQRISSSGGSGVKHDVIRHRRRYAVTNYKYIRWLPARWRRPNWLFAPRRTIHRYPRLDSETRERNGQVGQFPYQLWDW